MADSRDALIEAYDRLHAYGPEFGGDEEGNHGMTNHGPMAVEVMLRRGLDIDPDRWLDRYVPRLAELPPTTGRIRATEWGEALGDARRLPDWSRFFLDELREREWTEVLRSWWPRLVPGMMAGSTHGVIRAGHAVRALRSAPGDRAEPQLLDELAHGLAFWAARFRTLPGELRPAGRTAAGPALAGIVRLSEQSGFIAHRLQRLADTAGWEASVRALRATAADEVPRRLDEIIAAATRSYLAAGPAAPVLLVHAATAPNAVRQVLPVLPVDLWEPSLTAAWAASAALVAAYAPPPTHEDVVRRPAGVTPSGLLDRASGHADEHVLKFADTAVDAFERTGDDDLLAAAALAVELIPHR